MHLAERCFRGLFKEADAWGQTAMRQITGGPTQWSASKKTYMCKTWCSLHGWVWHPVYSSEKKKSR